MGVKTRLLTSLVPQLRALAQEAQARHGRVPVLLDMFCGTGVVGHALAPYARVLAVDAQSYATTVAGARLAPAAGLLTGADDLLARAEAPRAQLCASFAAQLAVERTDLAAAPEAKHLERYRKAYLATLASGSAAQPSCGEWQLLTAYYGGIYFGWDQATWLDSLRCAVEQEADPATRRSYMAALVFVASRLTSATAHFAQPRTVRKLSEVRTLLARRRLSVPALFRERLRHMDSWAAAPRLSDNNEAHTGPWREVATKLTSTPIDIIYADPPYTADNYSRFYHVLETLVRYDYPALATRNERLLKGRYPEVGARHRSAFCSAVQVEDAFSQVCRFARQRRAALVWSYSATNGLLITNTYRGDLTRFQALLERDFEAVNMIKVPLRHSGAGSRTHQATELIAVCTEPRAVQDTPSARQAQEVSSACDS